MANSDLIFAGGIDPPTAATGSIHYDTTAGTTKVMDGTGTWIDMGSSGTTITYPNHYDVYDTNINKDNPAWEPGKNEDKGEFMLLTLGDFSPFHTALEFMAPGVLMGLGGTVGSQTVPFNQPWDTTTTTGTGTTLNSATTEVTFV
jgi:hypothetical protein